MPCDRMPLPTAYLTTRCRAREREGGRGTVVLQLFLGGKLYHASSSDESSRVFFCMRLEQTDRISICRARPQRWPQRWRQRWSPSRRQQRPNVGSWQARRFRAHRPPHFWSGVRTDGQRRHTLETGVALPPHHFSQPSQSPPIRFALHADHTACFQIPATCIVLLLAWKRLLGGRTLGGRHGAKLKL